jgi:hypothetical protein
MTESAVGSVLVVEGGTLRGNLFLHVFRRLADLLRPVAWSVLQEPPGPPSSSVRGTGRGDCPRGPGSVMRDDGDGAAPVMNGGLRHGTQVGRQTMTMPASAHDQQRGSFGRAKSSRVSEEPCRFSATTTRLAGAADGPCSGGAARTSTTGPSARAATGMLTSPRK